MKIDFSILIFFLVLLFICAPVFQSSEYSEENAADDESIQQKVKT
jgi:hypothetical protein